MQFSLAVIVPTILIPLRYHFSRNSGGTNLVWDQDEHKRTIDIYEAYDINKTPLQERPRIIVMRGAVNVGKTGLSDNLATQRPFSATRGNRDAVNQVFYQGAATITVEARNKGTCELLADMATHFMIWSIPEICNAHGWKDFGLPLSISECIGVVDEDPKMTKFQVQIQVPWMKEEHWQVKTDGGELKRCLLDLHLKDQNQD